MRASGSEVTLSWLPQRKRLQREPEAPATASNQSAHVQPLAGCAVIRRAMLPAMSRLVSRFLVRVTSMFYSQMYLVRRLSFGRQPSGRARRMLSEFPVGAMTLCAVASVVMGVASVTRADDKPPRIVNVEYLYETSSFPQCHAATLAETPQGLVAAWFGGTAEGRPDVGIWFARRLPTGWTKPVEVATGAPGANGAKESTATARDMGEKKTVSAKSTTDSERRYPCWNPVLFQFPDGPLALYYKVGPSPSTWWGMAIESMDGGATWSPPRRLPDDIAGPIKNKPVLLSDGRLLCGSSTEDQGWRVHLEWTADRGRTWERTKVLNDGREFGAIQPTILRSGEHGLLILCRARGVGQVLAASSDDSGRTWSKLAPIELPNPNSGIDGVTLRDGRHLLVYNHTPKGRSPLNVALSRDGRQWTRAVELETDPGEYSYPAVIQAADGAVHILYTWRRQRIRHVTLAVAP